MSDLGLHLEVIDGVAYVSIDRPRRRNALDQRSWAGLADIVAQVDRRKTVGCAVLASNVDGIFAAGGDLAEIRTIAAGNPSGQREYLKAVEASLQAIRWSRVTWIAAIDGDCIGGALELACACDVRIATARSRFGLPAAALDIRIHPREVAWLSWVLGPDVVRRLLLQPAPSNDDATIHQAIVTESVDDAAQLQVAVGHWTDRVLGLSPETLTEARRQLAALGDALARAADLDSPPHRFAGDDFLRRLDRTERQR